MLCWRRANTRKHTRCSEMLLVRWFAFGSFSSLMCLLENVLKLEKKHNENKEAEWMMPLLLLEVGKSLLRLNEHQDAVSAFGHAKNMFEGVFEDDHANLKTFAKDATFRARYVELLLHFAKLSYLCGQFEDAETLWKKSIQFCMKTVGRDSYEILVATNGLSEYYLEQLRLQDASRYTAAAVELARELLARNPEDDDVRRKLRERLAEALSMSGLVHVQQQHYDAAHESYKQALQEIEDMERDAGQHLDNFLVTAFFNIYRNIEHLLRAKGEEEKAEAVAQLRVKKIGKYQDVLLSEQQEEKEENPEGDGGAAEGGGGVPEIGPNISRSKQ